VIVEITNVFMFASSITNVNTFGDRLRQARTLRRLTQKELAQACGLSQGAIGNYESNSRRQAKEVFRIAEALDVEPAWLAMGTGPMERQASHRVAEATSPGRNAVWPFPGLDPERVWALTPEQREALTTALAGMVEAIEKGGGRQQR